MNDERRTPLWLFEKVQAKFDFTIDLAASKENALLDRYYTKEQDSLEQDWAGEIGWCNPPYSYGNIFRFVYKALQHPSATLLMLIQGDSSTKYGQLALERGRVLFIDKRIAFDNEPSGARFPSWLVLFHGTRRDVANLNLLDLGIVL